MTAYGFPQKRLQMNTNDFPGVPQHAPCCVRSMRQQPWCRRLSLVLPGLLVLSHTPPPVVVITGFVNVLRSITLFMSLLWRITLVAFT